MSLLRKITMGFLLLLGALLAFTCGAIRVLGEDLPSGASGPEADAFARKMEAAVRVEDWARTGAVRWTFRGRNSHLWDRRRMLDRVVRGDETIWIDLTTRRGVATKAGEPLAGPELDARLSYAWAAWANDSFWLNPIPKLFDAGVTRQLVELDGERALLVRYSEGGVTPGDSYVWFADADGTPKAWRMWVAVNPVPGLKATWEDWKDLRSGARVATRHELPGITVTLTDVEGAQTLEELTGEGDPFAPLFAP